MQNENQDRHDQYLIYTDILSIFRIASEIQWKEIRQTSIFRILYLSSVLYTFRFPEEQNLFSTYKFTVDHTGPYDVNIANAITFLVKDDYLHRTSGNDILRLGSNQIDKSFKIDLSDERISWIKHVMYILGIYGENKIYDFIFRDPEYQETIKSNTSQGLNTGTDNATVRTLKKFQSAFEETLPTSKESLSSQTYLELYFEYVFSKILKREGLNDGV